MTDATNTEVAADLRSAAKYLRDLTGEFWTLVKTPKVSGEEMGKPLNLIADAGFDTPEMADMVADWLSDAADRIDATISGTSARSKVPDLITRHILNSRDYNSEVPS